MIIRVKRPVKNAACVLFVLVMIYCTMSLLSDTSVWTMLFGASRIPDCNPRVRYNTRSLPKIALIGPRGSGVEWFRYLIEQMTGIYTDSVDNPNSLPDGKRDKVILTMSHQITSVHGVRGIILVYRGMKDTVRSQYAHKHGPGAFLEAPLSAYYGKEWSDYAAHHALDWVNTYTSSLQTSVPLLIVDYADLYEPDTTKMMLLRISNFLHVPIVSSVLDCVAARATPYMSGSALVGPPGDIQIEVSVPKHSLKSGFEPFTLLEHEQQVNLDAKASDIAAKIKSAKENYRPRVR